MRNISIPPTPEAYREEISAQAFPDSTLTDHPFYQGLISWVSDNHTPLLYEQTHPDEYTNFSINFNWLLLRDYAKTELGEPDTIQTMYALHEFAHMTFPLPTNLDQITPEEYAEAFTESEYRASNETEIAIHYRIPDLRSMILAGTRTIIDTLRDHKIPELEPDALADFRATVIETNALDDLFATPDDAPVLNRLKSYTGNRPWARHRYDILRPLVAGLDLPRATGLSNKGYNSLAAYSSQMDQQTYESHIIRNVRYGYIMCGLMPPSDIKTLSDAAAAVAEDLEGNHAIV